MQASEVVRDHHIHALVVALLRGLGVRSPTSRARLPASRVQITLARVLTSLYALSGLSTHNPCQLQPNTFILPLACVVPSVPIDGSKHSRQTLRNFKPPGMFEKREKKGFI